MVENDAAPSLVIRRASWWRTAGGIAAAAGLLAGFYLVSYRDCLGAFLHFDDFWALGAAAQVHLRSLRDIGQIFRPTHGFVLYRPVSTVLYFYVLRLVFGYDPVGYHATQIAFHVVNGLLVYAIADCLLFSRGRALATAAVYATAPGHAIAVFWVGLFTVTGTAFIYFLGLWVWLRFDSRWRVPLTFLLFVIALLAGEHAVSFPIVLGLAAILLPERCDWRRLLREQLAFYALAGAYVAAKLYYLAYLLPITYPDPAAQMYVRAGYAMSLEPQSVLRNLGHYFGFAIDGAYTLAAGDTWALVFGSVVAAVAVLSTLCVLTGRWTASALRVATFGLDTFIVTLGPVLVLRAHVGSYYVGIAGLGMALAVIGFAAAVPRWSRVVSTLIVAALLVVHFAWTVRVVRQSEEFKFFDNFSRAAERWLYTLTLVTATQPVDEVVIPEDWMSNLVFDTAHSHQLFLCADYRVRTTTKIDEEPAANGRVIIRRPIPQSQLPQSRAWMRRACAAHARIQVLGP